MMEEVGVTYRAKSHTHSLVLVLFANVEPSVICECSVPRCTDAQLRSVATDECSTTHSTLRILQTESVETNTGQRTDEATASPVIIRSQSDVCFFGVRQSLDCHASFFVSCRPVARAGTLCCRIMLGCRLRVG
jgi:hypothetical protein